MIEHLELQEGDIIRFHQIENELLRDDGLQAGHFKLRRVLAVQQDGYLTQGFYGDLEPSWDKLLLSQAFVDEFAHKLMSRPDAPESEG